MTTTLDDKWAASLFEMDSGASTPVAPLHGIRPPARDIERERAVHRLAAYLFTTGLSQREIAEKLGVSAPTVSNWWRQPWFQEFVRNEMALSGRDTLQDIIRGAATDSVFTLIRLRDDEKTPASVKRACCSDIIDRAFGKAPQTVHSVQHDAADLSNMERVTDDLRQLLGDKALMQSFQPSQS
jgi:transcriptional regulator with XRE-family HTH domain